MGKPSKQELQQTMEENAQIVRDYLHLGVKEFDAMVKKMTDRKGGVKDEAMWQKLHQQFHDHERQLAEEGRGSEGIGKAFSNVVVLRQLILRK